MKNSKKIISSRDDGFYITFATWKDFPKLKKIVNELLDSAPEEEKRYYYSWMFRKNPTLEVRLGQVLVRTSLIPRIGKLIKFLYPFGYAIILKCVSKDEEIVGVASIYNFKRRPDGNGFVSIAARWVIDKYQNRGLGGKFLMDNLEKVAKNEKVTRLRGMIYPDNEPSMNTLEERGWKIIETEKDMHRYRGGPHDIKEIVKDL